jgi:putative oxidoreductase
MATKPSLGGYGFSATMNFFTGQLYIPALFAILAIAAEFAGSIALIAGFLSRIFGVRHYRRHARGLSHGPRIEWILYELGWNQKGEGCEYHLLAIGLALVVILSGAGKWSIDRLLARRLDVQRGMIADLNRRLPSDIQPAPEHGAMISTKP